MSSTANGTAREILPCWMPFAVLALTTVAIFYRILLGESLFWGLPALQFWPWREFALSELRAGRMPLWNPYNGGGAPLIANYQSALFYPPNLLYLILPSPWTMGLIGILHVLWCGLGMVLLARRYRVPVFGQTIAALSYPLSTTLIARFGTLPMQTAASWLPWIILTLDILVARFRLSAFLGLALCSAMLLLAGHAQWAYYILILTAGYSLWQVLSQRRRAIHLLFAALAITFGVALSAVQILPTTELQRASQRATGLDQTFTLNFSLPLVGLVNFLNPVFYGNPGDGSYGIGGAYFETTAYVGILPITLAIVGAVHYLSARVFRRNRNKTIQTRPETSDSESVPRHLIGFFTLMAIGSLIMALARDLPIFMFFYRYVPTFNLFQAPARWLLLTVFSATMIAALSSVTWRPGRRTRAMSRLAMTAGGGLAAAGGIGLYLLFAPDQPLTRTLLSGMAVTGLLVFVASMIFAMQPRPGQPLARRRTWMIAVIAFVAVDLWWANSRSNPTTGSDFYAPRLSETLTGRSFTPQEKLDARTFENLLSFKDYRIATIRREEYRASQTPNLNLLDRIASLNNFDPLRADWTERFTGSLADHLETPPGESLLDAAWVGSASGVLRSALPAQRAWLVSGVTLAKSPDEAEQIMLSGAWNPRQIVVVEADASQIPAISGAAGSVTLRDIAPDQIVLSVESANAGIVYLADTWYPGWIARDDQSRELPILRANLAFRAIPVKAGTSTITLRYEPRSFAIGAGISLITCLGFVALIGIALIRARRPATR